MVRGLVLTLSLAVLAALEMVALAADWPQWMGPNRDGEWNEAGVLQRIPETGLKVKWKASVEGGYSGPAVADGRVFVTDYAKSKGEVANDPGKRIELQGKERVLCFDAGSGKLLWKHEYDRPYAISYPAGPRATPTVDGDRVYTLGAHGNLLCLQVETGKVVWEKALETEYHTTAPQWGFSGHPLVDGDKLICLVGGEGSIAVAFDKRTGRELWKALSASEPGYCPPSIIEAAGVRQLLIWDADKINSLNPETGEVYWSEPLKPGYGMSIMAPRKAGNLLFASGIGKIGAMYELDEQKPGIKVLWRGQAKTALYAANTTPLIEGDVIYGVDCDSGMLTAVDTKTGARLWETAQPTTGDRRGRHGTAFLVRNGNNHWIFSETGDLILARLSRAEYQELGRFKMLEPTAECFGRDVVWTHPAFANRSVYARNDKEIVCVSLAE